MTRIQRSRASIDRRRSALLGGLALLVLASIAGTSILRASTSASLQSVSETAANTDQQQDPIPLFEESCLSLNPYYATPCFSYGDQDDEPALVAFHASPDGRSDHVMLATHGQIGATWGLAFDVERRLLYVGAFHKRGVAFGPGGTGMIYRHDLETGETIPWLNVPETGRDFHESRGNYIPDEGGRDITGKVSLGDVDLNEDGTEIYVMNLLRRQIFHYRVSDQTLLGRYDHGAFDENWARVEARPFGLKFWEGKLYHGVVRDASVSERRSDLHAYVYESEPDGSDMHQVLEIPLNYDREGTLRGTSGLWRHWINGNRTVRRNTFVWPQPWLTDIEFSDEGDMIVGLRDRMGDTTLFHPEGDLPPGEQNGIPTGDILMARRSDDRWEPDPNYEFFSGDNTANNGPHLEISFGGIARNFALPEIVLSGLSPLRGWSGGAVWMNIDTGRATRREELYYVRGQTDPRQFGKANGLGDVELLCKAEAPPTVTPTASDTATNTATATDTATPQNTPSSTNTPTPSIYKAYLPFGNKDEFCPKDAFYTDVVLVLDRSTSMLRAVEPGGIPKNAAAIEAAKSFVGNLDFTPDWRGRHDQVAVVGFNDLAWIESDLSSDPAVALAALDRIVGKTQEGTRLDLAFTWGQKPLDGPNRKPENRPVIIMLTDGLPNRVPFGSESPYPGSRRQEDSVLMAVDAVKATGSRVYTVGLGTPRDILPWLLIDCASERWMYHYAPRPEELAGIYDQIAREFDSCDPKPAPTPCSPEFQHADVVLVLDMSTSMYRTTRTGRAKYEAAIAAARAFVAQLDLERDGWGRRDQVAIVGFNGRAWTSIGLGDDRGAIEAAIDRLEDEIQEGTRLDLALAEGQRVYEVGERLQPNTPVMILLTDGLPNQVPFGEGSPHPECDRQECTVLKFAAEVKRKGTRLYTIGLGLGDDVLRPLMENVATDPSMYYHAPDGEDLEGIYRQIAGRLSDCP